MANIVRSEDLGLEMSCLRSECSSRRNLCLVSFLGFFEEEKKGRNQQIDRRIDPFVTELVSHQIPSQAPRQTEGQQLWQASRPTDRPTRENVNVVVVAVASTETPSLVSCGSKLPFGLHLLLLSPNVWWGSDVTSALPALIMSDF